MSVLSYIHQLFDAEHCQAYIHTLRWKDRPLQCPRCQSQDVDPWGTYHYRPGCKRYWCNGCQRTFNDLTGDGHADMLIAEDQAFVWHASRAEAGFGPAQQVYKALDENRGPRLVFADVEHT